MADLNKDGNLDIALANHERKFLTVLLGNGKGQFRPASGSPVAVQVKDGKPGRDGTSSADNDVVIFFDNSLRLLFHNFQY